MASKTRGERLFRILKRTDTSRTRKEHELKAASLIEIEHAIYAAGVTGNIRIVNILKRELNTRQENES